MEIKIIASPAEVSELIKNLANSETKTIGSAIRGKLSELIEQDEEAGGYYLKVIKGREQEAIDLLEAKGYRANDTLLPMVLGCIAKRDAWVFARACFGKKRVLYGDTLDNEDKTNLTELFYPEQCGDCE